MRAKAIPVEKEKYTNILETLYVFWKVKPLSEIAKDLGITVGTLNGFTSAVRGRSEKRYGERFKILPKKMRVHRGDLVTAVEKFLDDIDASKLKQKE